MEPFEYVAARDEQHAIDAGAHGMFIAGGTNMVDYLRLEVLRPHAVVDITALPLAQIEDDRGGLRIGALVRNSELAHHPLVRDRFPLLSMAVLAGASPQIRNLATTAGNLLQRTRCPYYRDTHVAACNKRAPGSGCAAVGGVNRSHAILGTSPNCIATNPSDMNVALAALGAVVHTRGPGGEREIAFENFHTLPGDHPEVESVLKPGELVTHVSVPALPFAKRSRYTKVRDRQSFAFALASAAVALDLDGNTIRDARVALGGVATRPWRSHDAERALIGRPASVDTYRAAADAALAAARTQPTNAFKLDLARRTLVRTLVAVAGGKP